MRDMYDRLFSRVRDPQIAAMIFVLVAALFLVAFLGKPLGPVLMALVVAYLLEGLIGFLRRLRIPRPLGLTLVFSLFIFSILWILFYLTPVLLGQLNTLLAEIPRITENLKKVTWNLSSSAKGVIDSDFVENILLRLAEASEDFFANSVTYILQGIPGLFSVAVYLFLVPFLVFFLLKDKEYLIRGVLGFLPQDRKLLLGVLEDANKGLGGYIRGKFLELLIVGTATYIAFALLKTNYTFLLAFLSGVSVLIPYLGLVVAAVPVIMLGIFQWGLTWDAGNLFIAFAIIQILDGIVFQPLILGEAVQVHPALIVLAILIFGWLWGVWGVFFAVPLAVLVKSLINALSTPNPAPAGDSPAAP